ncbi:MAG: 4Fe-4S binding protein [Candidatus Bathyarchaeota archaeon]
MRGRPIKQENLKEIVIERKFLTTEYLLRLNKNLCNGCGICSEVCPQEAIKEIPPSVYEGHLIEKPTIDIDANSCILCGECAVLCPLNALSMKINGEEIATIVKNEAFPSLIKEIKVMKEKCDPECGLRCQEECPTESINVSTKSSENGKTLEITDVQIDETSCFYCKRCELACNQNAIAVKKPFIGRIDLDTNVCPEDCVACVDICPTQAIQIEKGKPEVTDDFCIFCSACEKVCPNKAIQIHRDWILHTEVKAAAWLTALKKLTSSEIVAKELRVTSGKRRAAAVQAREISNRIKPNPPTCTKAEEFLKILSDCRK